jgi:hypothetical protein
MRFCSLPRSSSKTGIALCCPKRTPLWSALQSSKSPPPPNKENKKLAQFQTRLRLETRDTVKSGTTQSSEDCGPQLTQSSSMAQSFPKPGLPVSRSSPGTADGMTACSGLKRHNPCHSLLPAAIKAPMAGKTRRKWQGKTSEHAWTHGMLLKGALLQRAKIILPCGRARWTLPPKTPSLSTREPLRAQAHLTSGVCLVPQPCNAKLCSQCKAYAPHLTHSLRPSSQPQK